MKHFFVLFLAIGVGIVGTAPTANNCLSSCPNISMDDIVNFIATRLDASDILSKFHASGVNINGFRGNGGFVQIPSTVFGYLGQFPNIFGYFGQLPVPYTGNLGNVGGSISSIGGFNPSVSGPTPSVSGSVSGSIPSIGGFNPSVSGSIPPVSGSISSIGGFNPSFSGFNPSVSGPTPSIGSFNPSVSGSTPPVSGSIPSIGGFNPSLSGSTPPVSGSISSIGGFNPSVSGLIPSIGGTTTTGQSTSSGSQLLGGLISSSASIDVSSLYKKLAASGSLTLRQLLQMVLTAIGSTANVSGLSLPGLDNKVDLTSALSKMESLSGSLPVSQIWSILFPQETTSTSNSGGSISGSFPSIGGFNPSVSGPTPSIGGFNPSVSGLTPLVSGSISSIGGFNPSVSGSIPSIGGTTTTGQSTSSGSQLLGGLVPSGASIDVSALYKKLAASGSLTLRQLLQMVLTAIGSTANVSELSLPGLDNKVDLTSALSKMESLSGSLPVSQIWSILFPQETTSTSNSGGSISGSFPSGLSLDVSKLITQLSGFKSATLSDLFSIIGKITGYTINVSGDAGSQQLDLTSFLSKLNSLRGSVPVYQLLSIAFPQGSFTTTTGQSTSSGSQLLGGLISSKGFSFGTKLG